ncbi:MAG: hypothetical protein HQK51_09785 [Oligoflexia bacterium]|nr:hypothetical protein [Oligoflexia bacterium]
MNKINGLNSTTIILINFFILLLLNSNIYASTRSKASLKKLYVEKQLEEKDARSKVSDIDKRIVNVSNKLSKIGNRGSWNFFSPKKGFTYLKNNEYEVYQNFSIKNSACEPGVSVEGKHKKTGKKFNISGPIFMNEIDQITASINIDGKNPIEYLVNGMNVESIGYQIIFPSGIRLFFQKEGQRDNAMKLLKDLRDVCRSKKKLDKNLDQVTSRLKELESLIKPCSASSSSSSSSASMHGKDIVSNLCDTDGELHVPPPIVALEKRTYPVLRAILQNLGISTAQAETVLDSTSTAAATSTTKKSIERAPSSKGLIEDLNKDEDIQMALLNGKESFALRSQSLEKNKGPIRIQVLHWGGDEAGVELAERLIRMRKEEGRDVKVYVDPLSPMMDIRNMYHKFDTMRVYFRMMAAGIPVYGFECKSNQWFPFVGEESENFGLAVKSAKMKGMKAVDEWRKKMHEKIWVIGNGDDDNGIAITGGINIVNDYFQINPEGAGYWRDQDVATKGKRVIKDLAEIIDQNIKDYMDPSIKGQDDPKNMPCFNPHDPLKEKKKFDGFWDKNVEYNGSNLYKLIKHKIRYVYSKHKDPKYKFGYDNPKEVLSSFKLAEVDRLKKGKIVEVVDGDTKKEVERDLNPKYFPLKEYRVIPNRPRLGDLHAEDAYITLLNNAKREVWIANSYFMPTHHLIDAIKAAVKRGVKINILSNSKETNDLPIMLPTQRYAYKELLDLNRGKEEEKITIYEFTGKDKKGEGRQRRGMYHAKHMIVDEDIYVVGSYNLDTVSRSFNSEIVQVVKSSDLAKQSLKNIKEKDLEFCKKITYADAINYHNPTSTGQRRGLKVSNSMRGMF